MEIIIFHKYPGARAQVEGMRGTREGDEASRRYNAQLALHTLRFAINGHLRAPPAGLEEAVRAHFRLLRWRILRQVLTITVTHRCNC